MVRFPKNGRRPGELSPDIEDRRTILLGHVEESEFQRERARVVLGSVVEATDLEDYLAGLDAIVADMLTAAQVALHDILADAAQSAAEYAETLSGETLPAESLARAVEEEERAFVVAVTPALSGAAQETVSAMRAQIRSGVSDNTLRKAWTSDELQARMLAGPRAVLRAAGASAVARMEDRLQQEANTRLIASAAQKGAPVPVFIWITMEDEGVCEGPFPAACVLRHAQKKTMADWRRFGLPKSPILKCSVKEPRCRCILEAEKQGRAILAQRVKIREAVQSGRARARAAYGA